MDGGITINGQPLCFYHFSGFDSGAQEIMLNKYIGDSYILRELRDWYIKECKKMGQDELAKYPCVYNTYDNGELISNHERILYRSRLDLQQAFPNPFSTTDVDKSYHDWYRVNVGMNVIDDLGGEETVETLRAKVAELTAEIQNMKRSRTWQYSQKIISTFRK